ncbi:GDSL-type esterase/lipase family protein [Paenibacillus polysaccharolyticus]|uniref:GDSL-type esterase/lipase family protein n=1 Tax=Paenibacillus polysaccharolyticus TaxID=582692 RepID=UPI00300AB6E8
MAFNPQTINKELDMANLTKHNANYSGIKAELDAQDERITANSESLETTQTELSEHIADSVAHLTGAEHDKLTGIDAGAEVNQNAFTQINNVTATTATDTLTIVGGIGITVSTNPATKQLTVTATGDAAPGAHATTHLPGGSDPIPYATDTQGGLMSAEDKISITESAESIANISTALGGFLLRDEMFIPAKDFGVTGTGVETTQIQNAINAAKDAGLPLHFEEGSFTATEIVSTEDVRLFGDNASLIVGGETYKLAPFVEQQHAQIMYARAVEEIAMLPSGSLNRAERALTGGSLRVAVVGDSITEGSDQISSDDCYVNRFESDLRRALPGVSVTVQNFALGGRTLAQFIDPSFVGVSGPEPYPPPASGFYRPWSTVGKSWLNTVRDWQPDILIIAFGMNDTAGTSPAETEANNLETVLSSVNMWYPVPSTVLIPTTLPTKNKVLYSQGQNVTNSVARATREVGRRKGLFIADANRLFQILRDGRDVGTCESKQELDFLGYNDNSKWSGDKSFFTLNSGVLSPTGTDSGKFVIRNKPFYDGTIQVDIMPTTTSQSAWINYRRDVVYGYMTVYATPGNGDATLALYKGDTGELIWGTNNLTIPVGEYSNVKIIANGSRHVVYLNNVKIIDVFTYKNLHSGNVSLGSNQSSVTYRYLNIVYRDAIEFEPAYSEQYLLGKADRSLGGNGINHPTSAGHAIIFLPTLYGVIKRLASVMSNSLPMTTVKSALAAGATVELFSFLFPTGLYKSIFVEVTSSGIQQGLGSRITTTTYHLTWNNNSASWTQLSNYAAGSTGNQLTHTPTGGSAPKLSCTTVGTTPGSELTSTIRIVGEDCAVTKL